MARRDIPKTQNAIREGGGGAASVCGRLLVVPVGARARVPAVPVKSAVPRNK